MSTALILLAVVIPLSFLIIYYLKYNTVNISFKKEGFTVLECPPNTTSYITDNGNTNCCSSEVINNFCSNIFCSLSPGPNNCSTVLQTKIQQRSAVKCPVSVAGDCNNYFTNSSGTIQGCSKSTLNADSTGPSDLTKPYCRLYPTAELNTSNYDSCRNYLIQKNAVAGLATCSANARLAAQSTDLTVCKEKARLAAP